MYVHICVCVCVCLSLSLSLSLSIYLSIYVYIYVHTNICVYTSVTWKSKTFKQSQMENEMHEKTLNLIFNLWKVDC